MKKRDWLISIIAGFMLGIAFVASGGLNLFLSPVHARAASQLDNILTLMLNSHTKWNTVQGQAEFTWYSPDGSTQVNDEQFAVVLPDKVYIDITTQSVIGRDGIWISDGDKIYDLNKQNKTYTEQIFPSQFRDTSKLPTKLSDVSPDTIIYHPLSMVIQAPIREYLFPSWFAQGHVDDVYTIERTDSILGRNVWVVDYQTKGAEATAWIDQSTGMVLQYSQSIDGKKFVDVVFTSLVINETVSQQLFSIPAEYTLAPTSLGR